MRHEQYDDEEPHRNGRGHSMILAHVSDDPGEPQEQLPFSPLVGLVDGARAITA